VFLTIVTPINLPLATCNNLVADLQFLIFNWQVSHCCSTQNIEQNLAKNITEPATPWQGSGYSPGPWHQPIEHSI
jgi:hypothetical protein